MFYTLIDFLKTTAMRLYAPTIGVLMLLSASPLSAALLFQDGLNYSVGQNLNNQVNVASGNTWLKPNGPTGATNVIVSGDISQPSAAETPTSSSLSIPRAPSGSNAETRINVPPGPGIYTRASGATLYFSFTMKMTSFTNFAAAGSDTKNDAAAKNATNRLGGNIAGFHGGAASTSTGMTVGTAFAAPVLIRREIDYTVNGTDGTLGTQTGKYELGILKQFATPGAVVLETAFDTSVSFGVGDVVLVVGQYDFVDTAAGGTNDIARLWINPTPGDLSLAASPSVSAPATALNLGSTLGLESFHVKGDTNTPGDFLLDNIRIGTTFADVLPAAVPEPNAIALFALAILFACGNRERSKSVI